MLTWNIKNQTPFTYNKNVSTHIDSQDESLRWLLSDPLWTWSNNANVASPS